MRISSRPISWEGEPRRVAGPARPFRVQLPHLLVNPWRPRTAKTLPPYNSLGTRGAASPASLEGARRPHAGDRIMSVLGRDRSRRREPHVDVDDPLPVGLASKRHGPC